MSNNTSPAIAYFVVASPKGAKPWERSFNVLHRDGGASSLVIDTSTGEPNELPKFTQPVKVYAGPRTGYHIEHCPPGCSYAGTAEDTSAARALVEAAQALGDLQPSTDPGNYGNPTKIRHWAFSRKTVTGKWDGHKRDRLWEHAGDAWAEAAGAAGAYAPRHIAAVLTEQDSPDLLAAVVEGTKRAQQQHDAEGDGGASPRGLDVYIRAGKVVDVVWYSDTHTVTLTDHSSWSREHYEVKIECPDNPMRSHRVWAAMVETANVDLQLALDDGEVLDVNNEGDYPIAGDLPTQRYTGKATMRVSA